MSGYVPKRVRTERTAMGSTDANSTGKNGHSTVSTIGRRSTLRKQIQTRSFGSMWQINYLNAKGDKCERERLVPLREKYQNLVLNKNVDNELTIYNDGKSNKGFMNEELYKALLEEYPDNYVTDRFCAAGAINNNIKKIYVGTNYVSNTASPTSWPCAGKEILAIGRWQNGTGWGSAPWSLSNGQAVYIAFKNLPAGVSFNDIPHFNINGITATPSGAGGTIIATNQEFQGLTTAAQITVVMYGPGTGSAGPNWLDNIFNSGFDDNREKKITLQLK